MLINDKPLNDLGAKLLMRKIGPATIERHVRWPRGAKKPWFDKDVKWGFKTLQLDFEFKGDHKTIERNKSRLINELADTTLQFVVDGFYYRSVLIDSSVDNQPLGFEVISTISYAYAYSEEVASKRVYNGNVIALDSTAPTPVVLSVKPASSTPVTITGLGDPITIKDVATTQTIVVDAEEHTIQIGSANAYEKYDSWDMPFLKPGDNPITISPSTAVVHISYKPRWL